MADSGGKEKYRSQWQFYLWNMLVPLLMGTVLYILFRPDTYITSFFYRLSGMEENGLGDVIVLPGWLGALCRNFLPDILWAYALTFGVGVVWRDAGGFPVFTVIICALFEVAFELGQGMGLWVGTFDWWDIGLEICATVLAALILNSRKEKVK